MLISSKCRFRDLFWSTLLFLTCLLSWSPNWVLPPSFGRLDVKVSSIQKEGPLFLPLYLHIFVTPTPLCLNRSRRRINYDKWSKILEKHLGGCLFFCSIYILGNDLLDKKYPVTLIAKVPKNFKFITRRRKKKQELLDSGQVLTWYWWLLSSCPLEKHFYLGIYHRLFMRETLGLQTVWNILGSHRRQEASTHRLENHLNKLLSKLNISYSVTWQVFTVCFSN